MGKFATLPVNGLPVLRDWYVIHRRGKRLSPAAQAFKSFLLEQGAELIERALG